MRVTHVDVAIVGAGVTGTALDYILAKYSNVKKVVVLEKNRGPAQVNSAPINNAQTSHDGGTETNYSLEHALQVKAAAVALRRYVVNRKKDGLYQITDRMALAVGADEVALIEKRFSEFREYYPDLRLVYAEELALIEPMVMKGRSKDQPVAALVSNEGYAINYQILAECFIEDVRDLNPSVTHLFDTKVNWISYRYGKYALMTDKHAFIAKVVIFATGPYSLWFAHMLGYGTKYAILSVAGNFYSARNVLRNKVYRVQQEGLPFAEVHGDPNVLDQNITRFGPTTKPVFEMERHLPSTFVPFAWLGLISWRGISALIRILSRKGLLGYLIENYCYDLPFVGKHLFLHKIRKMVPTLKASDLRWYKDAGGLSPQIVNLETGQLEMGEKTILGENVVFETTPSPGASVCLRNAVEVAESVVAFLGEDFRLDHNRIFEDLGLQSKQEKSTAA